MPILIVHEIGKKPVAANVDKYPFIIGRDETSDLVLSNVSVSRTHASILRKEDGCYWAHPIALNNGLLVDGQEIQFDTQLTEGSGLQIGRYSLVFTLEKQIPTDYLQTGSHYIDVVCADCGWGGQLSRHRFGEGKTPPQCPQCAGADFKRFGDAQQGAGELEDDRVAAQRVPMTSTKVLASEVMADYHERHEAAQNARVERIGGSSHLGEGLNLSHDRELTIGKHGKAQLGVEGLCIGDPVTIRWERDAYVIRKGGWRPVIRINGEKVSEAKLEADVVFHVGRSKFRFTVG